MYLYIHLYYILFIYTYFWSMCSLISWVGVMVSNSRCTWNSSSSQINPAASQPKIPWKCSVKPGEAWCWQGEVSPPSPTWKEEKHCHAHNGSDSHDGQHLPDTKTPCPVSNQTQLCGVQTGKKCMQPKKCKKCFCWIQISWKSINLYHALS